MKIKNESTPLATAMPISNSLNLDETCTVVPLPLPEVPEKEIHFSPTEEEVVQDGKMTLDEIIRKANEKNGDINNHQMEKLKGKGYRYPEGLVKELGLNVVQFPLRYWIVDNRLV